MRDVRLVAEDGSVVPLDVDRWYGPPIGGDIAVLDRVLAPVVDLGCGPGRHVVALARVGIPVLGIDAAPAAVVVARSRGAMVLERSIFSRIPGTGRWGTVLLLDGNIGIGGDPAALLSRARQLVRAKGRVLVELAEPGIPSRSMQVRFERDGIVGPIFPWAVLGVHDVERAAVTAGLRVKDAWIGGGRWFAELSPAAS